MPAGALIDADGPVRGCHRPIGVVEARQVGHKLDAAGANGLRDPGERGLGSARLHPGDRRLRGVQALCEFNLR